MTTEQEKREAARGHYRTTVTNWDNVSPYLRFRYERARERLPARGTVFELGCGVGVGLAYLARSCPDLRFVGVDLGAAAIAYGKEHFCDVPNLEMHAIDSLDEMGSMMPRGTFLVAFEVLEHLDDEQLRFFKTRVMQKVDASVFSFPYQQQNIEGTEHLQSFDIYDIFEHFPGFETVFLRRHSIKFIGAWRRQPRHYLREHLNVAGEAKAIAEIANIEAPILLP